MNVSMSVTGTSTSSEPTGAQTSSGIQGRLRSLRAQEARIQTRITELAQDSSTQAEQKAQELALYQAQLQLIEAQIQQLEQQQQAQSQKTQAAGSPGSVQASASPAAAAGGSSATRYDVVA
jgi:hypothetical protein